MGVSKSEYFNERQNRLAAVAKALGHPARIAIVEFLLNKNDCICGDLVDELPLSQSTVSQHLKELKKAGIIQGTISGPSVCYCINTSLWADLKVLVKQLFELPKAVSVTKKSL